jgi:hypothetical protein
MGLGHKMRVPSDVLAGGLHRLLGDWKPFAVARRPPEFERVLDLAVVTYKSRGAHEEPREVRNE